MTFHVFRKIT